MIKENAKKVADDIFARYKNETEVFVTSDGQAFVNEIHAKNHANSKGAKLEIFPFQKDAQKSTDGAPAKAAAKELIEQIGKAESAEAVTAILETEKAGENRKSVIEAAEKKIAELSKSE
ncbi:MAG: hypothetical protein LBN27_05920 [Prevotellaceae bacterium]|nr:hypothetical protein [Prevotellaceae bacterium]